ncbi:MAG: DUF3418 domain-containing protein, partial [Actinobacteria bacterium]|nr:DUF3418 domain-containing protein [Actinomycetota bacterium]
QMLALGLGDIAAFPFLTPPDKRGIADGLGLLAELGAVRQEGKQHRITKVGRELSRLPIEPRFARMVLEAQRHGVVPQVIAIVAGLTIQDVRERPTEKRAQADQLHARFADPLGDLMTLLNLWNYLQDQQRALSSSAFRRLCKAEFLNFLRVREWMDLVRQLSRAAKDQPHHRHPARKREALESRDLMTAQGDPATSLRSAQDDGRARSAQDDGGNGSAELIHRSILAGLLSQLGVRDDTQDRRAPGGSGARGSGPSTRRKPAQEYLGSRGTRFALHPGSVLAKRPPEVIMSVELVETSRLFARSNAVVEPEWAEELAGPLAKRQLSEPRWEKHQGAAVAYERVTLYGVPIVGRRRVQLARFDLPYARELFIRHALVEGEWDAPGGSLYAFDRGNRQLRRELEQLEERTRRRGLVGDDEAVFEFYDARLPAEIASTRDFEGWWKREQRQQPKLLSLRREDLLDETDEAEGGEADQEFPRQWRHGDQTLRLRYRFDPTADDDGVTVTVPLPLLPRIEGDEFEKLVPGLREELVTALIKTLPKAIRKHVVPAADWARTLLAAVGPKLDAPDPAPLTALLADEIRRRTSVPVTAADFDPARLPAHLTPTFRVIDERGRTIGSGKDL